MGDSGLLPALLTRLPERSRPDDDDELVEPGNAYATVRGPRKPPALKFLRNQGRSFAMSYHYLPIPWWKSPDSVLIEYPGLFTVELTGHGLGELQTRLCDQSVTWIRECGQPMAASLSVAVTRILIVSAYPSRLEADIKPDTR